MKAIPSIFSLAVLCLMCGAGEGHGDVPKKPVLSRYSELWTNSAFTIPPAKEVVEVEEDNPLDEYTLAGTCEVEGGYVTVLLGVRSGAAGLLAGSPGPGVDLHPR